jgi:hypothetical protein
MAKGHNWSFASEGMFVAVITRKIFGASSRRGGYNLRPRGLEAACCSQLLWLRAALSDEVGQMIKTVKLDSVFEMGEGTERHRLLAEWHETVGIGYPKDRLATCYASEKDIWPELRALRGQRVWLCLRGDKITGAELAKPGWDCFEAIGEDWGDGVMVLSLAPWEN